MKVIGAAVAEGESEFYGWMMWWDTAVWHGLDQGDDFVGPEPGRGDAGVVDVSYGAGEGLED